MGLGQSRLGTGDALASGGDLGIELDLTGEDLGFGLGQLVDVELRDGGPLVQRRDAEHRHHNHDDEDAEPVAGHSTLRPPPPAGPGDHVANAPSAIRVTVELSPIVCTQMPSSPSRVRPANTNCDASGEKKVTSLAS